MLKRLNNHAPLGFLLGAMWILIPDVTVGYVQTEPVQQAQSVQLQQKMALLNQFKQDCESSRTCIVGKISRKLDTGQRSAMAALLAAMTVSR